MKKQDFVFYELNPSQEVVKLQCQYTLFKRVINIVCSVSTKEEIDFDLMKKTFNLAIERNDCARIRFVKKGGKLMQYFLPEYKYEDIPVLKFKTKEEQKEFIQKQTKTAVKYMKGEVVKPYFINTFDGKCMIFLKVCHLNFDIYGLNVFIKDLFGVYESLKFNKDLPEKPKNFEDVVKKDIQIKNNEEKKKEDYEYFKNIFENNPEPYYAGVDGITNRHVVKARNKNQNKVKLFFIKNDTKMFGHSVPKSTSDNLLKLAQNAKISLANVLLYAFCVTQSKMNGNVEYLLPLELCNLRGTLTEKKCAGTKAQSLNCYTKVIQDMSFAENLQNFAKTQNENYRHIGMKDLETQMLLHKTYKSSMMSTYYSLTFSFIPYEKDEKLDIRYYSNGKCALPLYVAVMYDYINNEINIGYDGQVQLMTEQNIEQFHKNLILCLNQILENPEIKIKDIML